MVSSFNNFSIALPKFLVSFNLTKIPQFSVTCSEIPPTLNPTTGIPQAIASITVLGKLSSKDDVQKTSARL